MYYQLAKEHWGDVDGMLEDRFKEYLGEPLHSMTYTEDQFAEETARQMEKFKGKLLFTKNKEDLQSGVSGVLPPG